MSGLGSLSTPRTPYWSVKLTMGSITEFVSHAGSTKYPNWPDTEFVQQPAAQLSNKLLDNCLEWNRIKMDIFWINRA